MTPCPPDDRWIDFLRGAVTEQDAERLEAHLDQCTACESRVEAIEETGRLFTSSTQLPNLDDDSELSRLQQRLLTNDSPQPLPEPGAQVGHYRLLNVLGQGGMGRVYLAEHESLKRWVALKLLSPRLLGQHDARERFRREMQAVGRINHPNLLRATDAGEIDHHAFIAMEYVPGVDVETLAAHLGPMPVGDTCEIVGQAAEGLAHAHHHDLVHRDVKPSNLLLGLDGIVRVLDLGLARFLDYESTDVGEQATGSIPFAQAADDATATDLATRHGSVLGTRAYMAPEQKRDSRVDGRADLYALGATWHRLLFGSPPDETLLAHSRQQRLAAWQQRRGDVPQAVLELLADLLQPQPEARPESMRLVAQRLSPFRNSAQWQSLLKLIRTKGLASPLPAGAVIEPLDEPAPDHIPLAQSVPPLAVASKPTGQMTGPSHEERRKQTQNHSLALVVILIAVGLTLATLVAASGLGLVYLATYDSSTEIAKGQTAPVQTPGRSPRLGSTADMQTGPPSRLTPPAPSTSDTNSTTRSNARRVGPRAGDTALRLERNGKLEIRDTAYWLASGKDFTVELWLRVNSVPQMDTILLGQRNTSPFPGGRDEGWRLGIESTASRTHWSLEQGNYPGTLPGLMQDTGLLPGHWHHLALARQGHWWSLFLDGERILHSTVLASPGLGSRGTPGDLVIGHQFTMTPSQSLPLEIAGVRLSAGGAYEEGFEPEYPLTETEQTIALLDLASWQETAASESVSDSESGSASESNPESESSEVASNVVPKQPATDNSATDNPTTGQSATGDSSTHPSVSNQRATSPSSATIQDATGNGHTGRVTLSRIFIVE